jgi:hypothetical protein
MGIISVKLDKNIAKEFVILIHGMETNGEEIKKFTVTIERGVIEVDLSGKLGRKYIHEYGDYITPPYDTLISENVWNLDLICFIDGEPINIENKNEIIKIIEKSINN